MSPPFRPMAGWEISALRRTGSSTFWRRQSSACGRGLPLSPTGYGGSPYSALSAFAGNPVLISLERLVEDGWIAAEQLQGLPGGDSAADFETAAARKLPLIEEAAANFLDRAGGAMRERFQNYCHENINWLPDYAMFN